MKDLETVDRLFYYYSLMLTEKQREVFTLFYFEDLSLQEISENVGISRQGVHDTLKKSLKSLESVENKIGLAKMVKEVDKVLVELDANRISVSNGIKKIRSIFE